MTRPFDPVAALIALVDGGVDFIVVGPDGTTTGDSPEEGDLLGWHRVLQTDTSLGPIDIVPFAIGVGPYRDLITGGTQVDIEGRLVWVASIEDVIASKEAAGRAKDLRRLPALREFRDRQRGAP